MSKMEEKILNTTIKLFIRDGIKKITMDDIAGYSKVSKVTIYKYFVDKDTFLFKISQHIFSDYRGKLDSSVASGDALIKKLYVFLDIISDFTNSGKLKLCSELAKYNSDIEAEYELYLQTYRKSILTLIDEGVENGLIKRSMNREMIYHYINMGIVYYQQNIAYRNKMLNDNSFQNEFMSFYISNIFIDSAHILTV